MNENNHLPVFGIGPYLMAAMILMSLAAIFLSVFKVIPYYPLNPLIMTAAGTILIVLGIAFWLLANLNSKITANVENNRIVTAGIYGVVRHPIYAAFLYAVTGFLLIADNLTLMILPVIYIAILTLTMMKTEEKWLFELYGDDYLKYAKEVKRFIPKVI